MFEITSTIYSNNKRSEQYLKQNAFFTCSWRFLISNKLEQLKFKLDKIIGIKKHAGKVRKSNFFYSDLVGDSSFRTFCALHFFLHYCLEETRQPDRILFSCLLWISLIRLLCIRLLSFFLHNTFHQLWFFAMYI